MNAPARRSWSLRMTGDPGRPRRSNTTSVPAADSLAAQRLLR